MFTDTPGFHKPRTLLGSRLNELVADAVDGVDLVILVVDGASGVGRGDAFVYERQVASARAARFCVVNKVDALCAREDAPAARRRRRRWGSGTRSSRSRPRRGDGVDLLRELILARLPEGPPLFPVDEVTDQPLETRLAELIREQALRGHPRGGAALGGVVIEEMEREGDLTRIHASIVVERDSQKGIVIGKGGETLKTIGTERAGRDRAAPRHEGLPRPARQGA